MRILIKNGMIFTLDANNLSFEQGDLLVEDDCISKIGDRIVVNDVSEVRIIDATHKLILPGMVNACLIPQNGMWKGVNADGHVLAGKPDVFHQNADISYWLTLLAGLEMLQCGVTTVVHQWVGNSPPAPSVHDAAIKAYRELGIRAVMAEELRKNDELVVIYNPLNDLFLGEPLLPIYKYEAAGKKLALGTGESTGGNHNMFDVLKMTFAMQRILQPDYRLWPTVYQVLEMATTNGAKLCELQAQIGSLVVGKKADLAIFDVHSLSFSPLNNPLDQFVCLEDGSSLDLMMVNGKVVFEHGQALGVDEVIVKENVNALFAQTSQKLHASIKGE